MIIRKDNPIINDEKLGRFIWVRSGPIAPRKITRKINATAPLNISPRFILFIMFTNL